MKTIRGATILALVSPLGGTRGFIPAVCSFARASRKSTRTEVLAHPGERAKELRWGEFSCPLHHSMYTEERGG